MWSAVGHCRSVRRRGDRCKSSKCNVYKEIRIQIQMGFSCVYEKVKVVSKYKIERLIKCG